MSNTRKLVIETLLQNRLVTIVDLAEAVEISPISVRHHINKLLHDGLVESKTEKHGVGRPRNVFFLTEKGRELFPSRMIRLTSNLISQIKESLPKGSLEKLFRDLGTKLQNGEQNNVKKMSLDQRLAWIDQRLSSEGFAIDIERTEDEIRIHESNCPYYHVGQTHHEVCTIDQEFINTTLESESTRTSCLLDGDSKCTYIIPMDGIEINMPHSAT